MTAAFPLSDVQFSQSNYKEGILQEPSISSPMDSGPPKTRSRFSATSDTFQGQLETLSSDDYDTLIDFWKTTLVNGSLPFTWEHPRTHADGTFKFKSRPAIIGTQGITFIVSIDMYSVP